MPALTIIAGCVAAALALSAILRASDRFPTEVRGPGPWGIRSRQAQPPALTSAERRWSELVEGAATSSDRWNDLTAELDRMADILHVPRTEHPAKFSYHYVDQRLAALETPQGDKA